jgi:hypothetical protein
LDMSGWWPELFGTEEERRKLLNTESIGDARFWVSYLKVDEHPFVLFVLQFGSARLEIA